MKEMGVNEHLVGGRRKFLKIAALGSVGAPLVARAAPWGGGTTKPDAPSLPNLAGETRIAEVRAFALRRAVYVKVVADNGMAGWGEAGHSGGSLVAQLVNGELAGLVKGMDVFAAHPAWARMYFEADELGPSGLASQAIGGVDCALWDLRGKLLNLPVWKLLGGRFRERIPLYGSFSRSKGGDEYMTPVECARQAAELVGEGFRAIKVRLGIREENLDPPDDPALPVVREIRRAIGDNVELYVDANNGYSPSQAIRVGKELAERFGVAMFEEPVAAFHYRSLAAVAEALDMPVSAGEHEYSKWQFRDLILQGNVDVLNPDVSKCAGLTEAMKISSLAETFDLPISVHNARPTLLTAAHAHFVAACPTARRPQEHPGSKRLTDLWQYFENRLEVADGVLKVPDAPGLGLIPIESAIERATSK